MAGTLRLTREGVGIELRRRPFDIEIDGTTVGTIESHGTVDTSLEPGEHTVRLRSGRYTSRPLTVGVADGSMTALRCHSAMVWPRYLVSAIAPGLGIALKPE